MLSIFSCFAGGAFFNYNFMGKPLRDFKFFPQNGNNRLRKLVDLVTLDNIIINLFILVLFGAVFASIGKVHNSV